MLEVHEEETDARGFDEGKPTERDEERRLGDAEVNDADLEDREDEENAEDRLTHAEFSAMFADPRKLGSDGQVAAEAQSEVSGYFRFYFQRGQPAQPF